MNVRDNEVFTPIDLINAKHYLRYQLFLWNKPVVSVYGSNNPLAEITHKRRLSALGPGGLSRKRI
jgi:DNA-directed RNA polymerase subunit beta